MNRRRVVCLFALFLAAAPDISSAQGPAHERPAVASHDARAWDAARAFAERWSVPAGDVRIEWSTADAPHLDPADEVQIRGDGSGGRYVIEIRQADGAVQRTWIRAGVAVPVARARIDGPRGVKLDSTHVEMVDGVAWGGPAYAQEQTVIGWVTRRPIAAGDELIAPAVAPPNVVTAGADVRVIVNDGPVRLMVGGRALGTAAAGEQVRVRLTTGRRMTGIAEAEGLVVVDSMETGR